MMELFKGAQNTYGIYNIEEVSLKGKTTGEAATKRGELTIDLWNEHLCGRQGLGVVPIRGEKECFFGAIDVDDYSLNLFELVDKVRKKNLPIVVCRTKSGGVHLYVFVKNGCPAVDMRNMLSSYAAALGVGGSEIFPKQNEILVKSGDSGNWINMPYFNSEETDRYAVEPDTGKKMSIERFLEYAAIRSLNYVSQGFLDNLPEPAEALEQGPPCLNKLLTEGIPEGMRNDTMALGIVPFAKLKDPDNWQTVCEEINNKHFHPPLSTSELQGIFKSAVKKDWCYACTRQPLKSACNRQLCMTKKYGVRQEGLPVVGSLSKLDVEPPIWYADIEGEEGKTTRIPLSTEALQNFSVFQKAVMEKMHKCPQVPKRGEWHAVVNEVMADLTVIEAPPETRPEGIIKLTLWDFWSENCNDSTMACVWLGQVYQDESYYYFRGGDFLDYLTRKNKDLKRNTVYMYLREMGAKHKFFNIDGRGVNLYYMDIPQEIKVPEPNLGPNDVPF